MLNRLTLYSPAALAALHDARSILDVACATGAAATPPGREHVAHGHVCHCAAAPRA